jgi:hypothetical protein
MAKDECHGVRRHPGMSKRKKNGSTEILKLLFIRKKQAVRILNNLFEK